MADNMECPVCGGTDFSKDAGLYYCNECQTQSQEVREHAFQDEVTNLKGIRRIKKKKAEKQDDKITSWECYNIVMSALTDQLIDLGAHKNIKPIVKCLWIKYLEKLEVLDLKTDVKPRLQLPNSKRDADIIYGKNTRSTKRKRTKSLDGSCPSVDTNLSKREQTRRKKALAEAHYEEFSQKSTQESTSLHNETLASLKTASEKSENSDEPIYFNRYSVRELKKEMPSAVKKQKLDKTRSKVTYLDCSTKFIKGVQFLSPIKLYAILYLGLLINRDEIQLSDFLRFIREGHLAFDNYTHFFPEEYREKFLNIQDNSKTSLIVNKYFRTKTAQMATFLNIASYIKIVDLTALCERFCKELNLPDEVYAAVRNIISKSNPKLSFSSKSTTIPNYEGRAMSIIVFTLKLLFGLDGVTEWEMSRYARSINKLSICKQKMFDIIQWMEYIGTRNLLIAEHHFPSSYEENSSEIDSDKFLKYIEAQEMKDYENIKFARKTSKEMSDFKELLTKIIDGENSNPTPMKFSPTLTPFFEYYEMLNPSNIGQCFSDNSLDFLLRPNKYLSLVSDNLQLKHGGANDNWVMEGMQTYEVKLPRNNLTLIPVEVIKTGSEKNVDEALSSNKLNNKVDPVCVQEAYYKYRQHTFQENENFLKRISQRVKLENEQKIKEIGPDFYNIHYNPYERYWLYLQMHNEYFCKSDFDAFFNKHTETFKLIFNECARIIEQSAKELSSEFQFSELFLVFCATYGDTSDIQKKQQILDKRLKCFINNSKNHW